MPIKIPSRVTGGGIWWWIGLWLLIFFFFFFSLSKVRKGKGKKLTHVGIMRTWIQDYLGAHQGSGLIQLAPHWYYITFARRLEWRVIMRVLYSLVKIVQAWWATLNSALLFGLLDGPTRYYGLTTSIFFFLVLTSYSD